MKIEESERGYVTAAVLYLVPENVGERELVRAGNLLLLAEFLPALYYGFPISGVKGTEISHHTGCQQHIPRNVHQAPCTKAKS